MLKPLFPAHFAITQGTIRMNRLSAALTCLTLLTACGGNDTPAPQNGPIAAAWFYLSDTHDYQTIPAEWQQIAFNNVNVLYVGPAGVQANGAFGLFDSAETGPLRHRFEWLAHRARQQNPDIKIVISQWWGNGEQVWGRSLSSLQGDAAVTAYAQSVADFLAYYQTYAGGRYALDGFDIDYEDNNVTEDLPLLADRLRHALQTLSAKHDKPFRLTLSPADGDYLDAASLAPFDYINMQSYAGGMGLPPEAFLQLGVPAKRILFGICPETSCNTFSLEEVLTKYHLYGLGGVHLWRLNSDNYREEGLVQQQVYSALHP